MQYLASDMQEHDDAWNRRSPGVNCQGTVRRLKLNRNESVFEFDLFSQTAWLR